MHSSPERKSIKDWDEQSRPREKLWERGPSSLTDAELLGLLLATGTPKLSAVELAQLLLEQHHGLAGLARAGLKELTHTQGIGPAKAVVIQAAFELARRKQLVELAGISLNSAELAGRYIQSRIGDEPVEYFYVVFLNQQMKVLAEKKIAQGGITGTTVDFRVIFREAVNHLAVGMLVGHNHPSGQLAPSTQDKDLTRRLKSAADIIGIQLADHIIVSHSGYFSFADNGLL